MEYYFFDVKIQDSNTYLGISIYIVFLKLKTLKNLGNIMLNNLKARILAVIFAGVILDSHRWINHQPYPGINKKILWS